MEGIIKKNTEGEWCGVGIWLVVTVSTITSGIVHIDIYRPSILSWKLASSFPALLEALQLYLPASERLITSIVSVELTAPLAPMLSDIVTLEVFRTVWVSLSLCLVHVIEGLYTPVTSQYTVTLSAITTSRSCVWFTTTGGSERWKQTHISYVQCVWLSTSHTQYIPNTCRKM